MDLRDYREKWKDSKIEEIDLNQNPKNIFEVWMKKALSEKVREPNAMTLSTVGADGQPRARLVLLKEVSDTGFVFYTNYKSQKARDLEFNNKASLSFYWFEMNRQIQIEGSIKKISQERSAKYYEARPFESQIAALTSDQSSVISSREALEEKFFENLSKYKNKSPELPSNWGGYELSPSKYEFWQGRINRLHDRVVFTKGDSSWAAIKLQP